MWEQDKAMMNDPYDISCSHCYHSFYGVIHMVIKPGHTLEQCCKCQDIRQVHIDHCRHDHDDWGRPHKPVRWYASIGNKIRSRWFGE